MYQYPKFFFQGGLSDLLGLDGYHAIETLESRGKKGMWTWDKEGMYKIANKRGGINNYNHPLSIPKKKK